MLDKTISEIYCHARAVGLSIYCPSRSKSIMIQEEFSFIFVQYILLPISQLGDPRVIEIRLTVFYVFSYSRKGGLRNVRVAGPDWKHYCMSAPRIKVLVSRSC
jgi:hypothetical protein